MTEPCLKCRTEINAEAERCPACGYEPSSQGHPNLGMFIGGILTLTGVGAIVGLPLIALSVWHEHRRKEWKPTTRPA